MENCKNLILKNNFQNKIEIKNGKIIYKGRSRRINDKELKKMLVLVNGIRRFNVNKIKFEFEKLEFQDKLAYIIFEILIYSLISDFGIQVVLEYEYNMTTIHTHGLNFSCIQEMSTQDDNKAFCKKFENRTIERDHFRIIVRKDVEDKYFNVLYTDVYNFLSNIFPDRGEYINDLAEVIVELVTNAWEHAETDCLLDIDVNNKYSKKGNLNGPKYEGINVVVLNFSDKLFGENLQNKCEDETYIAGRYCDIKNALELHSDFFDEKFNYNKSRFFIASTMQDRISGRLEITECGGTGLTKLLKSLQDQSTDEYCYLVSGFDVFRLCNDYLERNEENWVGFNYSRDFLYDVPNFELFSTCEYYFPGTAYNLTFIV